MRAKFPPDAEFPRYCRVRHRGAPRTGHAGAARDRAAAGTPGRAGRADRGATGGDRAATGGGRRRCSRRSRTCPPRSRRTHGTPASLLPLTGSPSRRRSAIFYWAAPLRGGRELVTVGHAQAVFVETCFLSGLIENLLAGAEFGMLPRGGGLPDRRNNLSPDTSRELQFRSIGRKGQRELTVAVRGNPGCYEVFCRPGTGMAASHRLAPMPEPGPGG